MLSDLNSLAFQPLKTTQRYRGNIYYYLTQGKLRHWVDSYLSEDN